MAGEASVTERRRIAIIDAADFAHTTPSLKKSEGQSPHYPSRSASLPNAIEFILYPPANRPCARSQSYEAFRDGVTLGLQADQYALHGLGIHADQGDKERSSSKVQDSMKLSASSQ